MTPPDSAPRPLAALASASQSYVPIDEHGYFKLDDARLTDVELGADWLARLSIDARGRALLARPGEPVSLVEAFDEPFVAAAVEGPVAGGWRVRMPYGYVEPFALATLSVDEWDRFHGRTNRGIPFVLSRSAQAEFFERVDEFDDDGVTVAGERTAIGPWLRDDAALGTPDFWSKIYREKAPGWELDAVSPVFAAFVPRLKLPKCRVLVLGAGSGNDAAFFADLGHVVTAVDFSEEAIVRARAKYGHKSELRFVRADVFDLPAAMTGAFDLIVEHACFCAVNPVRRAELVRVWRRCLAEGGHVLGLFFTIDRRRGPPVGCSEWELRARLQNLFRTLYWFRSRNSLEARAGQEVLVYVQKVSRV